MKRWFMLLILLIPCAGCMAIEDMLFPDYAPADQYRAVTQPPAGSCGMQPPNVAALQTTEPELIQVRK